MDAKLQNSFLNKLIDWEEFECFVQKLYEEDPNLIVQHNVVLTGKSGAKRQIDVLVTQKTKLMKMVTIVECKRWKEKVNRAVIDVVSAAIDDLNANKGVVFTTSGYEEGAIEYARYKNIDIFLVRDLLADEWGKPGRHIQFWIQFIGSKVEDVEMPGMSFLPFYSGALPEFEPTIYIDQEDKRYLLYDSNGKKGLYIGNLLMQIQEKIHIAIGEKVPLLLGKEAEKNILYKSKVIVELSDYIYNILKFSNGIAKIGNIEFELYTKISQTNFEFDRGDKLDFAFIVDNYIINQKHSVIKHKNEDVLYISDNLEEIKVKNVDKEDVLENGSVMKVYLKANVGLDITGNEIIRETNDIRIKVKNK